MCTLGEKEKDIGMASENRERKRKVGYNQTRAIESVKKKS